jgi:hypothetical protein
MKGKMRAAGKFQFFPNNPIYSSMKRVIILLCLFAAGRFAAFAQADGSYDREILISEIGGVGEPYIKGNFMVFTAKAEPRHVGIAFDFEQFRVIHSYQRVNIRDIDSNIISAFYFYILDIPENIDSVSYKIISDGIWAVDPANPNTKFDSASQSMLSTVRVRRGEAPATRLVGRGRVRFVYSGPAGQKIQLGGSFTNWDPFIYVMKETRPGLYECEISLAPGTHYYNFYKGLTVIADTGNPERAYTSDGRSASVIEVK